MAYSDTEISKLEDIARDLRINTLEMINRRGAGHPGGSLSCAEIITTLYFKIMNIYPDKPEDPDRDRFILSKGHASAILYAALARRGFFAGEDLKEWGKIDCHLQGHPEKNKTPGIDMTTGILGHGVSVGAGLALSAKLDNRDYQTYVLLGDGEIQGGIVWEGALMPSRFKLNNLTLILDYNGIQLDGFVNDIMPLEPLVEKWESFNYKVIEVDGHNIEELLNAFDLAKNIHQPVMIIAYTTKGKGVSFMEDRNEWHGMPPDEQQLQSAVKELGGYKT
ncbi:MAG: transketolase [Halanaerobiales bacterium]